MVGKTQMFRSLAFLWRFFLPNDTFSSEFFVKQPCQLFLKNQNYENSSILNQEVDFWKPQKKQGSMENNSIIAVYMFAMARNDSMWLVPGVDTQLCSCT